MRHKRLLLTFALLPVATLAGQEMHDHPAPEKLGTVSFSISCNPETQSQFDRAIALLHSFAYASAGKAFQALAEQDPKCAIAHWGVAMTQFHQLWEPHLSPAATSEGEREIRQAEAIGGGSPREIGFIHALRLVFKDAAAVDYSTRGSNYEKAMGELAAANPGDVEASVFYALALLSNASPSDKQHERQKKAAEILEPLYRRFPDHPGVPHYLIHAYDNAELAPRGLAAARAYSKIAPSAPHALHMPSHIFTRLGLWDNSIASNLAARSAAHQQGDIGEELHAMDYLVYAYLQSGRETEAAEVIRQLREIPNTAGGDFKVGYASVAMPVRYAVERQQWSDAANITPPPDPAQPQVIAVAVWARGLGLARRGRPRETRGQIEKLSQLEGQLRSSGKDYWATQVEIMRREITAWVDQAEDKHDQALSELRSAADEEDGIEKLPVTPGPIVPAREQLGELLLEQGKANEAYKEFKTALVNAPGRRGALRGAADAGRQSHCD